MTRDPGAAVSCTDCGQAEGQQHRPSCHRQGVVTAASAYVNPGAFVNPGVFEAMSQERLAEGFSVLVATEADPRTPGGSTLFIGERRDGSLWVKATPAPGYRCVTGDELRELYPHAHLPALGAS